MIDASLLGRLSDREWWVLAKRRAATVDALLERARQLEQPDPIADLEALGVPNARVAWALGVVFTRVWLLELAGDGRADAWQLWRYTHWIATGIRDDRRRRRFGPADVVAADVEQARLELGIDNDRWVAIRAVAAFVLRDMESAL